MNDLYLSQFDPYAECITPQHPICKPKFPVFDMHTHMGNLVPGTVMRHCIILRIMSKLCRMLALHIS